MVFAAVSTVFISLFLFGGAYLINREVNLVLDFTTEKVEVAVFLKDTITLPDQNRLQTMIQAMPEVTSVRYESKAEAYARFKRLFANQPALTQNVSADALPASFRVKLKNPSDAAIAAVATRLDNQPGVETVQDQSQLLKRVFAVSHILQAGALVAAVVVLLSAAGLIGNTVRMSVFSRRREIGIMRLVGATNWFIRIPFIIEALIQALIGAGAAIIALVIFRRVFLNSIHGPIAFLPIIPASYVYVWIPIFLLIGGVAMAMVASFLAMRRFLEV